MLAGWWETLSPLISDLCFGVVLSLGRNHIYYLLGRSLLVTGQIIIHPLGKLSKYLLYALQSKNLLVWILEINSIPGPT